MTTSSFYTDGDSNSVFYVDSAVYTDGTFTPAIAMGGLATGVTYGTQSGKYTKVGKAVTVALEIILTSKGSATGQLSITGLPFTVTSALGCAAAVRCANLAASAATDLQGLFAAGSTVISITRFASGVGTALADTDLTNTSVLRVAGQYFVD